jgi:hypothetical protein
MINPESDDEKYGIGDAVTSVGGNFVYGIVEDIQIDGNFTILTVRWLKDSKGKDIDIV